ncbi:MAG: tryptophan 7-halogenase [Gammaproteobacteria bacterium]|nr:tryptophan 7-halogenase [Gammaproteobacteria bacterium]MYF09967.1 tryptophan 7-halogenase [Gammaproteobacteria bacterium]MYH16123.1 tryptophan 7-halogenase [Gammaproteobacteria bacterium]MYK83196.1 tryptophan 7-halogenase [Gammaproteobacteria bacterium]
MKAPEGKANGRIAVIGRGTAGALAAASVSRLHPDQDHELHHIYDSRIPIIGVGEGSWPSLVQQLRQLSGLPHEEVQRRLNGTRKYGVSFEGWGRLNQDFIHYFAPQQVAFAYHLSADVMAELLQANTRARHIDAKVLNVTKVDGGAEVEFEGRPPERYDLVFDARGFPGKPDPQEHINIDFIPTNSAVIRRCPATVQPPCQRGLVLEPTYTRAVARPHGWVFVIPLAVHTSYGYVYNSDLSSLDEVQADFDELLSQEGVPEFEHRAVIAFPNFVHRQIYDGAVARIGNAASFMEPLEATAIGFAQLQVSLILRMRFTRPASYFEDDAPVINSFLVNDSLAGGLFVGWHYCCGSRHDSPFWRYAKETAWGNYRTAIDSALADCSGLRKFDGMMALLNGTTIDESEWQRRCAFFPLTSFAQMAYGLGVPLRQQRAADA